MQTYSFNNNFMYIFIQNTDNLLWFRCCSKPYFSQLNWESELGDCKSPMCFTLGPSAPYSPHSKSSMYSRLMDNNIVLKAVTVHTQNNVVNK